MTILLAIVVTLLVYLDHGGTSWGWGNLSNIWLQSFVHMGCVNSLDKIIQKWLSYNTNLHLCQANLERRLACNWSLTMWSKNAYVNLWWEWRFYSYELQLPICPSNFLYSVGSPLFGELSISGNKCLCTKLSTLKTDAVVFS